MGKKKLRSKYTSKGERRPTNKKVLNAVRRDVTYLEKYANIVEEWRRGKNPWVTIPNPNDNETAKRFIRVKANEHFGDPREAFYFMKSGG